jgi:addiction module RelE/StbE family toxin
MKQYSIVMTEPAAQDLQQIADYIAKELLEPAAAIKLVNKIKEHVLSLADMPARHALVADEHLAAQGIRQLLIDNYMAFYIVSEKDRTVTIIRILYGRRAWEQFL